MNDIKKKIEELEAISFRAFSFLFGVLIMLGVLGHVAAWAYHYAVKP